MSPYQVFEFDSVRLAFRGLVNGMRDEPPAHPTSRTPRDWSPAGIAVNIGAIGLFAFYAALLAVCIIAILLWNLPSAIRNLCTTQSQAT